jgi:hypothetical protein
MLSEFAAMVAKQSIQQAGDEWSDSDEDLVGVIQQDVLHNPGQGVVWWCVWRAEKQQPLFDTPPPQPTVQDHLKAEWTLMKFARWLTQSQHTSVRGSSITQYCSHVKSVYKKIFSRPMGMSSEMAVLSSLTASMRSADPPSDFQRDGLTSIQIHSAATLTGSSTPLWSFPGLNSDEPSQWSQQQIHDLHQLALLQTCNQLLLRGAEAGKGSQDFQPSRNLCRADVDLSLMLGEDPHIIVKVLPLKKKKANQQKVDCWLPYKHGNLQNAAYLISLIFKADPQPPLAPLFCNYSTNDAYSTKEVAQVVKMVCNHLGLDPAHFGAHSMRIGGATQLLCAGVAAHVIQLMGRWDSDIFKIYTRLQSHFVLQQTSEVFS